MASSAFSALIFPATLAGSATLPCTATARRRQQLVGGGGAVAEGAAVEIGGDWRPVDAVGGERDLVARRHPVGIFGLRGAIAAPHHPVNRLGGRKLELNPAGAGGVRDPRMLVANLAVIHMGQNMKGVAGEVAGGGGGGAAGDIAAVG